MAKVFEGKAECFIKAVNSVTPPKINIEPENDGLEDVFAFQIGIFSGSMLVFRGVLSYICNPCIYV